MPTEPKDEALVVYAYKKLDDPSSGKIFSVPYEVYTDERYELKGGNAAVPKMLLKFGTVAANMLDDHAGMGGFCYLVNLPGLKPPPIVDVPQGIDGTRKQAAGATPRLSPTDVVNAIRALVKSMSAAGAEETALKEMLDEFIASLPPSSK